MFQKYKFNFKTWSDDNVSEYCTMTKEIVL